MPAVQQLLFPDPRPLVERLGVEFFRSLPAAPGVYLMRDNDGQVLYIGKAKNLRQRLVAYRVANPLRMKRRHLRLLRTTARIDIELCEDERAALAREAELLLALRPRFNRAGVWPAPERYLLWRVEDDRLEVTMGEEPLSGWSGVGPLGSVRARRLRTALVRLLWLSSSPQDGLAGMPWGWAHGRFGQKVVIPLPGEGPIGHCLRDFTAGDPGPLSDCLRERLEGVAPPLEVAMIAEDLEELGRGSPAVTLKALGQTTALHQPSTPPTGRAWS